MHACVGMAVHRSELGARGPYFGRPGRPSESARALPRPQPAPRSESIRAPRAKGGRRQARPRLWSETTSGLGNRSWFAYRADPQAPDATAHYVSGLAAPLASQPACLAGGARIEQARPVCRHRCARHPLGSQRRGANHHYRCRVNSFRPIRLALHGRHVRKKQSGPERGPTRSGNIRDNQYVNLRVPTYRSSHAKSEAPQPTPGLSMFVSQYLKSTDHFSRKPTEKPTFQYR